MSEEISDLNLEELPLALIMTAIPLETSAVLQHIELSDELVGHRGTVYSTGIFFSGDASWRIYVVECGAGLQQATLATAMALQDITPAVLIFVGIAGSIKDDVLLGDVVAAPLIYNYQSGKAGDDFMVRPRSAMSSHVMMQRASATMRNKNCLDRSKAIWTIADRVPCCHLKPIASGDELVTSSRSSRYKFLKEYYGDAVAVDMEGYGFLDTVATYQADGIVIRGISDTREEEKCETDKLGWQEIAAQNAAAFAFQMLVNHKPRRGIRIPIQSEQLAPTQSADLLRTLKQQFMKASSVLLGWRQTLNRDQWLDRDEFSTIESILSNEEQSCTLILGPPGAGKSALLSRMANRLVKSDHSILAIKADYLDDSVDSLNALAQFLNINGNLVDEILTMAMAEPVIIFIDQLDALSSFVDVHGRRLNILLNFIASIASVKNVHVLCSCREFEFNHDVRLLNIEMKRVKLEPVPWPRVELILDEMGMDMAVWPDNFRRILQNPQALKIFLTLSSGGGEARIFEDYHGMLEKLWDIKVVGKSDSGTKIVLIDTLVKMMANDELMWVPYAMYDTQSQARDQLEAAGILVRSPDGSRIGFVHQTVFDFALAKCFIKGAANLAEYVFERQNALFVRPRLWSALKYLRRADRRSFDREFGRLWISDQTRDHIRLLLVDLLGQIDDPSNQEIEWFEGYAKSPSFRARLFGAIAGKPQWYMRVVDNHLPGLMCGSPEERQIAARFLSWSWPFAGEKTLSFITQHWLGKANNEIHIWNALNRAVVWTEKMCELACEIVGGNNIHDTYVIMLAEDVSRNRPDLAPKLVATLLEAKFKAIPKIEIPPEPKNGSVEEIVRHHLKYADAEPYRRLLETTTGWHRLVEIAVADPKSFLDNVWPWFTRFSNESVVHHPTRYTSYPRESCIATDLDSASSREYPLVASIDAAVTHLASADPLSFLRFVEREKNTEIMVVQRLCARGFIKISALQPQVAMEFLLEDMRRFVLGTSHEPQRDTIQLLRNLASAITKEDCRKLEEAIMDWNYSQVDQGDSPEWRRKNLQSNRWRRLELLKALPIDKLSEASLGLIREEERRFPEKLPRRSRAGFGVVGSPMSVSQMTKAKDDEIVTLFNELTDETEWDHPRHEMKGGSIQASREFAELAKTDPQKAMRVMQRLSSTNQTMPVEHAVEVLAETRLSLDEILGCIIELEGLGFRSQTFRNSAAIAFRKRSAENIGLPDSVCALLEKWLAEWVFVPSEGPDEEVQSGGENEPESVLWGAGRMERVPRDSYTLLDAITLGYLQQKPVKVDRWFAVLKDHLVRDDCAVTWQWISQNLHCLYHCDRTEAVSFIDALFLKYPSVRDSEYGAVFLAKTFRWLPEERLQNHLSSMRKSAWQFGAQAFGEVLGLIYFSITPLESAWARKEIEHIMTPESLWGPERVGLAYAVIHSWNDPAAREAATSILVQLISLSNKQLSYVVLEVFRLKDHLVSDIFTQSLLEAMCQYPEIFNHAERSFLIERLQSVTATMPGIVWSVCDCFLNSFAKDVSDFRTAAAREAPTLVNIALTLQRQDGLNRERGLSLFEKLYMADISEAKESLIELDCRPVINEIR